MFVKLTQKDYIDSVSKIHNNKYDYSLVEYINSRTKIKIICPEHGVFEQKAVSHKQGYYCPKCSSIKKGLNKILPQEVVINNFNKIHNNRYDYSKVIYIGGDNNKKITIICKEHGEFEQSSHSHKNGAGCPKCKESKGEKVIREYLIKNKINFNGQHKFKDCKYINGLPFDFYLPELNLCIEFNGEQHYKSIKYWGGEKSFILVQKRDKIKMEYCQNNNIPLITIKYDENIIEKLNQFILM